MSCENKQLLDLLVDDIRKSNDRIDKVAETTVEKFSHIQSSVSNVRSMLMTREAVDLASHAHLTECLTELSGNIKEMNSKMGEYNEQLVIHIKGTQELDKRTRIIEKWRVKQEAKTQKLIIGAVAVASGASVLALASMASDNKGNFLQLLQTLFGLLF